MEYITAVVSAAININAILPSNSIDFDIMIHYNKFNLIKCTFKTRISPG
ncbi:MAG TPA: hypothetical protein VIK26_07995 [Clostridium sp.]